MKRAVITTGGTGGHIFPALAVARALGTLSPGVEILFVGGAGPEGELARKAGLRFTALPAKGVFGRGIRGAGAALWTVKSLFMARSLYEKFKPEAVIGFGGYAGFCPVVAGRMNGIPTAIHEQNSVPGMANKALSRIVAKVFVTYPDKDGVFPASKTVRTGNPVREEIAALYDQPEAARDTKNILVLGGSQGARAVNQAVIDALPALLDGGARVMLQTGRADFERVAGEVGRLPERGVDLSKDAGNGPRVIVENFVEDMAGAYAWADLIVARAGATTLAEVTSAKKPSILIPFPFATHNHQYVNARAMEEAGAARLVEQKDMDRVNLADLALGILESREQLTDMSRAAASLAEPKAAERIAGELLALAKAAKAGRKERG